MSTDNNQQTPEQGGPATKSAAGAPTGAQRQRGRWVKGTSGNPTGRPPGSRNQVTLMMESVLDTRAEDIIARVVELAVGGNVGALRLCLERLCPPRRDRQVTLDLPPMYSPMHFAEAFNIVTRAIGDGKLTPSEGETLVRLLDIGSKIVTTLDSDRRVLELELVTAHAREEVQKWQNYYDEAAKKCQDS